jgi:hypothetical protein
MAAYITLRSRVDAQGVFWRPDAPADWFAGRLVCDGRSTQLITAPKMLASAEALVAALGGPVGPSATHDGGAGPEVRRVSLGGGEQRIELLHGVGDHVGKVTLVGLYSALEAGSAHFGEGWSLRYRTYRVSLAVAGLHLPSAGGGFAESASFGFSRTLREYFGGRPRVTVAGDATTASYPTQPIVLAEARPPGFVLTLQLEGKFWLGRGRQGGTFEATVRARWDRPAPAEQVLELAMRLEGFFSLLAGCSVRTRWIEVQANGKPGRLLWPRRGRNGSLDLPSALPWDGAWGGQALDNWLPLKLRAFEALIFGALRHSSLFVETEFLALAQALEAFARATGEQATSSRAELQRGREAALGAVEKACASAELRQRFQECLAHAGEPNFHQRLEELLGRLSGSGHWLVGDPDFEQKVRQTRNHFTHLGIVEGAKAVTGVPELFLLSQRMHALLRALVLLYIGVPEDAFRQAVAAQAGKWR